MFVAFDGIDGAGKTSLVQSLNEYLKSKGKSSLVYDMGQEGFLDSFFNDLKNKRLYCSPEIRELLYYYEGTLFQKNVINNVIHKKDNYVIVDRYLLTYLSYGPLNGIPKDTIFTLLNDLSWPDIYFYIDISPEASLKRISKYRKISVAEVGYKNYLQEDEKQNYKMFLNHQKKVRNNYLENIAYQKEQNKNVVFLDGSRALDDLEVFVRNSLENLD